MESKNHKIAEDFIAAGWECDVSSKTITTTEKNITLDIVLRKNGKEIGCVETYDSCLSEKKQKEILYILEEYRPELFILTDGVEYEVYDNSKYMCSMTTPLSIHAFLQRKRLLMYANFLKKGGD